MSHTYLGVRVYEIFETEDNNNGDNRILQFLIFPKATEPLMLNHIDAHELVNIMCVCSFSRTVAKFWTKLKCWSRSDFGNSAQREGNKPGGFFLVACIIGENGLLDEICQRENFAILTVRVYL